MIQNGDSPVDSLIDPLSANVSHFGDDCPFKVFRWNNAASAGDSSEAVIRVTMDICWRL